VPGRRLLLVVVHRGAVGGGGGPLARRGLVGRQGGRAVPAGLGHRAVPGVLVVRRLRPVVVGRALVRGALQGVLLGLLARRGVGAGPHVVGHPAQVLGAAGEAVGALGRGGPALFVVVRGPFLVRGPLAEVRRLLVEPCGALVVLLCGGLPLL